MDLSVVIVSWNVKERLRENLHAIFKSKSDFSFEVFVADNNSHDGSVEMVRKEFPQVKLISNSENLGFAKANNQAIKRAKGDFILLLNPDMRVMPDTFDKMLGWMRNNKQATVAGCHLADEQGYTVKHVRRFPALLDQLAIVLKLPHLFSRVLNKYLRVDFDYSKPAKVDSIRGGFFVIKREALRTIPTEKNSTLPCLDERYFLWFEEVDFCQQVFNAGGEVWYTPVAKCIDYVGESFKQVTRSQTQKYFRDSMLKYFKKWHPKWQYSILKLAWPVGMLLTWLFSKLKVKSKAKT